MRALVAGVGNLFLSDDAFGIEVISRLARQPVLEGVELLDVGTGGIHLAYQLLDGYDLLVVVDALPHGVEPGRVCVFEPDVPSLESAARASPPLPDAHGLEPVSVLTLLTALDARPERTVVVGCEPADVGEGIGLSPPVEAAIDEAVRVVLEVLDKEINQLVRQRDGK
jgi:hydrogenase maturation protease